MDNKELFAFVLMPFKDKFEDVYKLAIKESAKECEIRAERLDEQLFGEGMIDRIYRQIDIADIIIADLSDKNANVFYELGFAHAKEKLCILLTRDADDIPFDLKHRRHVVYGNSLSYLKDELKKNILWAKKEIENRKKSPIRIDCKKPSGTLTTTKHVARCSLIFTFDLYNDLDRLSPEISAIYLYTGNKWNITQDGKECSFTDADISPFKHRYFLTPPSSRLGRKAWAQIKCTAKRVLARAWDGDEITNSYSVGGRGIIRIVTEDGNFDHEFDFNLEISEIPF